MIVVDIGMFPNLNIYHVYMYIWVERWTTPWRSTIEFDTYIICRTIQLNGVYYDRLQNIKKTPFLCFLEAPSHDEEYNSANNNP